MNQFWSEFTYSITLFFIYLVGLILLNILQFDTIAFTVFMCMMITFNNLKISEK